MACRIRDARALPPTPANTDTIGMRRQARQRAALERLNQSRDRAACDLGSCNAKVGAGSISPDLLTIPPSIVLTLLISWFHGSLFFLLDGARGRQLLFFLALATVFGVAGQILASSFKFATILDIGDCSVVAVVAGCWLGFALTRLV